MVALSRSRQGHGIVIPDLVEETIQQHGLRKKIIEIYFHGFNHSHSAVTELLGAIAGNVYGLYINPPGEKRLGGVPFS